MTKTNKTSKTNPADLPHAIYFAALHSDGDSVRMVPCIDGHSVDCLDTTYAIYPNRATADANLDRWNGSDVEYFVAPASAAFDTKVKFTFVKRKRGD